MSTLLWLLTEAGLVLCWLVTPWAPAPWLALCWLMAPLAGWLALLLTRKRSQVRLTCPVTAEKGKPFSVTAEVRQGVPFGRGRLTVSVENTVTGETHREKLTLHQGRGAWQVQSACCGCLVMQAAELVLWDLLGVLPVRIPCTVQGRICVMPDTFPIEADPVSAVSRQTDCEEYAPDVRGSDPTEIFQIREYVPGDSLRQIHWKLSAKAGRYMVRDAAKPVDHRLTIYVERRTAPPRLAAVIGTAVQLVAGIPSVGYGLVCMIVLVPAIRRAFGLGSGACLLAAILVLTVMVLPSIINVAETALQAVPREYEEASLALGATETETYFRVSLPAARSGVAAAVVLGVGRAIGEAMAIIMVAGNVANMPGLFTSVRFLTTGIISGMSDAAVGSLYQQALFSIGLVLFLFIMLINVLLNVCIKRKKED